MHTATPRLRPGSGVLSGFIGTLRLRHFCRVRDRSEQAPRYAKAKSGSLPHGRRKGCRCQSPGARLNRRRVPHRGYKLSIYMNTFFNSPADGSNSAFPKPRRLRPHELTRVSSLLPALAFSFDMCSALSTTPSAPTMSSSTKINGCGVYNLFTT